MPVRPRKISKTPSALDFQDTRGDVLADVLGVALLRHALYKRIEGHAPWGMSVPARPRAMFYLIARGSALLEVEGEPSLSMSACDVVFLPHGTAHVLRDAPTTRPERVCDGKRCGSSEPRRIGGNGTQTSIVLGFFELGGRPPALLERMPNVVMLSPTRSTTDPWVSATVQLMLAESASPGPASVIILQRLADILFVQALRSISTLTSCKQPGLAALADPPVHEALGLMHARVDARWTVAELASRVGLSRSGFATRFASLVGEPPLQYLARWRIARAAELLRDTKSSVDEVSARVGYESVPSFSKAFKRWRGVSPGAFRRLERDTAAARRASDEADTSEASRSPIRPAPAQGTNTTRFE